MGMSISPVKANPPLNSILWEPVSARNTLGTTIGARRYLPNKEVAMVAPMKIKEHMEVVGSDGVHVGTVDHLEGQDLVKLAKSDPDAGGEHHFIPLAWVDHVEMKVHLKQSGAEAKARWKTH
jgi:hypothetical protein